MTMRLSHEQLDRHRADAGRGRHASASVHVLHGAGGRAAQHGVASARRLASARRPAARAPWGPGCGASAGSAAAASARGLGVGFGRRLGFAAAWSAGLRRGRRRGLRGGSARRLRGRLRGRLRRAAAGAGRAGRLSAGAVAVAGRRRCRSARCCLKKSHQALSTLFGSRWYCSYISSTSHSLAPNAASGLSADSLSTGGCAFRRLGHGLDRLFR